jgi:Nbl1/borealin-like protein
MRKWSHSFFPFPLLNGSRSREHQTDKTPDRFEQASHVLLTTEAAASHKPGHRRYSPLSSYCRPSHLPLVTHRTRQLESWLSDTLAAFRDRHERHLALIPHLVRGMTMAEFGDKYDGDVQAALRGLQKERLTIDDAPLDRSAMKRKWVPPPEEEEHDTHIGDTGKNLNGGHARATKHREWSYLPPLLPI